MKYRIQANNSYLKYIGQTAEAPLSGVKYNSTKFIHIWMMMIERADDCVIKSMQLTEIDGGSFKLKKKIERWNENLLWIIMNCPGQVPCETQYLEFELIPIWYIIILLRVSKLQEILKPKKRKFPNI